MIVHQVRHDSIQTALPQAGVGGVGAGVQLELTLLLMLPLVGLRQGDFAAR